MIKIIERADRKILYWILSKKTERNCLLAVHFLIGLVGSFFIIIRASWTYCTGKDICQKTL